LPHASRQTEREQDDTDDGERRIQIQVARCAAQTGAAVLVEVMLESTCSRSRKGPHMLLQLLLATAMVVMTVLIHLFGLAVLMRVLRSHTRMFRRFPIMPLTLLLAASIGIIAIHTLEIWFYALVYLRLGSFPEFEQALYFSTVTYATIGYGDLVMPHEWRILGAIEGAAGIIMLGWSTAFLVSLLTQLKLIGHDWLGESKVTPHEHAAGAHNG